MTPSFLLGCSRGTKHCAACPKLFFKIHTYISCLGFCAHRIATALLLTSYFATISRCHEAKPEHCFWFCLMRMMISQGSIPLQEHNELSQTSSTLPHSYQTRIRWEQTKTSQTTATQTKQGCLRETELPTPCPLSCSLNYV